MVPSEPSANCSVIVVVPTPLSDHHTPDMSYIVATMDSIAGHLRPGQLIVLESTTYPGTTEELIAPAIERAGVKVMREAPVTDGVLVAYSPEREDPGNTTIDRRDIPKVVGGINPLVDAFKVDLQLMAKTAQIILRQFQSRFGEYQVGEVLPHLERRLSYLIVILRLGLAGRCPRDVQAPAPLLPALVQPGKGRAVEIRARRVVGWNRDIFAGE